MNKQKGIEERKSEALRKSGEKSSLAKKPKREKGLLTGMLANAYLAPGGHEVTARKLANSWAVHVFERPSRTDYACLRSAYSAKGLPTPEKDGRKPEIGKSTCLFLGKSAKNVNSDIENLRKLIDKQRNIDFPILLLPQLLIYGKRPNRGEARLLDKLFGPPDKPRLLRKWWRIFRANGEASVQAGEWVNLKKFLDRPDVAALPDAAAARMLLDTLRRSFYNHRRAVLGPPVKTREMMKDKIHREPILMRRVRVEAAEKGVSQWQVWAEVDRHLDEIMADYDVRMIRLWSFLLTWVWRKFFDGVAVDYIGLERVRRLAQNSPVIYVPSHKSHIDYLLVSYTLFNNHMTPPHIAAGANLNFWPLGYLFRKSGAFFLKRSFKGTGIYAAVFASYLRTLIREGFDIEFFIEGGRSRTGKLFLPKMGLLNMMLRAYEKGEAPNLNFVPISINYDRVPEEEELLGETQGKRMLPAGWKGMFSVLKRKYGMIHINFGKPMSLRGFLKTHKLDPSRHEIEERKGLYREFAFHIIHAINEVCIVTPNALAAAALLARKTPGREEDAVQKDAQFLLDYLEHIRARMAPTLRNPSAAISQALRWDLALDFVKEVDLPRSDERGQKGLKPLSSVISIDPDKRPNLEMYKNNILHWLYPAGFVAAKLMASPGQRADQSEIERDFDELKIIMKYELVYDNNRSTSSVVNEALEFFGGEGLVEQTPESSYQLVWTVTDLGRHVLPVFSGQIENLLEAYRLVFRKWIEMKGPGPEADDAKSAELKFAKEMVSLGLREYHLGNIGRRESISTVTFKNALALMNHLEKTGRTELADPDSLSKFMPRP